MHLTGAATHEEVFVGSNFFLCSQMLIPQSKEDHRLVHPGIVNRSYSVSTHSKEGTQKDLM